MGKENEDFSSSLMKVGRLAIWPIIGSLLHPIYMIVNSAYCGRMSDPMILSGFGLGSLSLGILATSLLICFNMGSGTLIG